MALAFDLIALVLLLLSGAGCLYLVLAAVAVRRLVTPSRPGLGSRPPVSVLKPLCGEDWGLGENLRSFCRQDYPVFQMVCGVRDADDGAIPVVRDLIVERSDLEIALVVDPRRRGGNLKIANLHNMLPKARHAVIAISDSDMRVDPHYLDAVSAPLDDPEVGIVTCLYRGLAAPGFWSELATLHVNQGFLPQAAVAALIGVESGCFGASVALRRETLERAGGLAAIEDALADDYALGAAVRRIGQRIALAPYLVDNVIAEPGFLALFRHELRWAFTVRLVAPLGYVGSIVTQPLVLALVATALGVYPAAAPAMLLATLLCRAVTVRITDRSLGVPRTRLMLLPLRDLLSFAVFVASFFVRRVEWRDQTFGVSERGNLTLDGDHPA